MRLSSGDNLAPMEAGPGRELRAAGGLWGPPARALQGKVQRRSRRLTGQRGCRLVPIRGSQCWQWLGLMGGSVFVSPPASSPPGCRRRQPGGDQFPSPANLIDANRPRGLTRDRGHHKHQRWVHGDSRESAKAKDACINFPLPIRSLLIEGGESRGRRPKQHARSSAGVGVDGHRDGAQLASVQ